MLRKQHCLTVRVAEAKGLPDASYYCTLNCGVGVFGSRTKIVEKTDNPFWGEDFTFECEEGSFRELQVVVWDHNKLVKDTLVGAFKLSMEQLKRADKEAWYTLKPDVSQKDYVSGEVRLELLKSNGKLEVKVIDGRNLASKDANGFSDPYVKMVLGAKKLKTKIQYKTLDPVWNECFTFPLMNDDELLISVWDWDRIGGNEFMGRFAVDTSSLPSNSAVTQWHTLEAMPAAEAPKKCIASGLGSLRGGSTLHLEDGSVRLAVELTEEVILRRHAYNRMVRILMTPGAETVLKLGHVIKSSLEEMARVIVSIADGDGDAERLLRDLNRHEITNTCNSEILFRGNSTTTKANDCFMKLVGMSYLKKILKPIIVEVFKEEPECEVDPTRLTKGDNLKAHWATLTALCDKTFNSIVSSAQDCPPAMRTVFGELRDEVTTRFPNEPNVVYTAISGFLFLRFICPAILGPKLFALAEDNARPATSRTLTLLSKTIQTMSNLAEFGGKEPYMQPMNSFIQSRIPKLKSFIDQISSPIPNRPRSVAGYADVERENAHIFRILLKNMPHLEEERATPEIAQLIESVKELEKMHIDPSLIPPEGASTSVAVDVEPLKRRLREEVGKRKELERKLESLVAAVQADRELRAKQLEESEERAATAEASLTDMEAKTAKLVELVRSGGTPQEAASNAGEVNRLKNALASKDQQVVALTGEVREVNSKLEEAVDDRDRALSDRDRLAVAASQYKEEVTQRSSRVAELEAELAARPATAQSADRAVELEAKIAKLVAAVKSDRTAMQERIEATERELSTTKAALSQAQATATQHKARADAAEKKLRVAKPGSHLHAHNHSRDSVAELDSILGEMMKSV